jgi:hypothetical protein
MCVLGALSSEERCTAVPSIAARHSPERVKLLKIADPPSRYSSRITEKTEQNYRALHSVLGEILDDPVEHFLFDNDELIASALGFLDSCTSPRSLWLDVTCLPKRFFFLLVKLALRDPRIRDLLVTYTQPAPGRYTDEHLAEDPGDAQPLPGFGLVGGDPDELIIAVGFESLGLPQLLGEYRDKRRLVLVPFPPGQPYSRRIWQTIMNVGHPGDANLKRVPALDVFDALGIMMEDTSPDISLGRPPALAPYGPKPISLAMCLYAVRFGSPVFYTQPRVYHPDYTIGVGSSWAYSLKRDGKGAWLP